MKALARHLLAALIVSATLGYFCWTGLNWTGSFPRIHGRETDYFNSLSRGFQKGHLYLDEEVPQAHLDAVNPYDPAIRATVNVPHDASYYRGKYYIYFGPAPVVTLFLPFSLVVGRELPLPYGVWVFSTLGYLALAGIFLFLQRRYFPQAGLLTLAAGLLALGGGSMIITLLRRAHIWELSAASGFGFFAVSLWCLIRALHSPRAVAWTAFGGLMLGLAVASRPTYIACSVLFAVPLILRRHRDYDWRALGSAAATCTLVVLGLFYYNYARFGNPFEFGQKYQLSAIIEGDAQHFSLRYAPFNFHLYFLSALRWLPQFPFQHGIVVPPFPRGHGGYEYTIGLFANLPFSLFSTIALAATGWHLAKGTQTGLARSLAVLAGAALINTALLLCYFGCCIRYMADFAPYFMLLAAFGVFAWEARLRSPVARACLGSSALVLALFSSLAAALALVSFYAPIPSSYRPVARVLNAPVFWWHQLRWRDFGPVEMALTLPADRTPRQETLATVTREGRETAALFLEYLEPDKLRFGYREAGGSKPFFSPAIRAPAGTRHEVRISIGGPYSDYDGDKGRLRVQLDEFSVWDVRVVSFGTYPGKLDLGPAVKTDAAGARFSGIIHSIQPAALRDLPRPRPEGIRIRITPDGSNLGKAIPLVTTGRTKAGDLFFIQLHRDGTLSFGYDHWGFPVMSSRAIPAKEGEARVVDFWLPALAPAGAERRLLVKVDGVTVWDEAAEAFPLTPETIFLGSNPIGGTTCEERWENAVFEELQLSWPAGAEK